MYYTVYKITNVINGKIYIGVHKTNNIDDGYMGSGKHLKHAQEKYGMENFVKEILEVFDNSEEMFQMESLLVNEDFVQSKETYNLKIGGFGGWDHLNDNSLEQELRVKLGRQRANENGALEKAQAALKYLYEYDLEWLEKKIEKMKISRSIYFQTNPGTFSGRTHTIETKALIGTKNSISQLGEKNSQFGTMWIHNLDLKESKKIKKEEFPEYESLGWIKGRKMKYTNIKIKREKL